jgi:hypothetical protein
MPNTQNMLIAAKYAKYTKYAEYTKDTEYVYNTEYIVLLLLESKKRTCYFGPVSTNNRLIVLTVAVRGKNFLLMLKEYSKPFSKIQIIKAFGISCLSSLR